jgi:FdhE protein
VSVGALPTSERLARDHPGWGRWLALHDAMVDIDRRGAWDALVARASAAPAEPGAPLLAGRTLAVDPSLAARVVRSLVDLLTDDEAGGARAVRAEQAIPVLEAAINGDDARLGGLADEIGIAHDPFRVVAGFAAIPVLRACERAWRGDVPTTWAETYCPVCGAWPMLAEARGLERSRRFRCGRCASDWHADWLACPFCGNRDHTRLGALVTNGVSDRCTVDTCTTCLGYLKTITTLQAFPPAELLLADLDTVELDVAAVDHGYRRPAELGRPPVAMVQPLAPRSGWRRFVKR